MKITFAYLPEEQENATACVTALRRLRPDFRIRESDRHSPFMHTYMTIQKPGKRCDFEEKP